MTTTTVSSSAQLRTEIQKALAADIVELTGPGPFTSITTLTKIARGAVGTDLVFGYTVQGNNANLGLSQTLQNTRIFQQNIDGPYAPGTVKNLTLSYTAGGAADGNALLSVENAGSTRNFIIDNVSFTGVHSGWNGNGNKYMSLIGGGQVTINAAIELKNSAVSITGQNNGFQTSKGTVFGSGSAFFHNWNNQAAIKIQNTNFDEAGFLSSFNLLNITTGINGSALIAGNTFRRTANINVRWEGNRLQNVDATLSGNTFSDGSYLDLYGNVGSIKINDSTTANTFNTIANGYGIRMTDAITGTPTITGSNVFTGGGLALKFEKATAGSTSLTTSGAFTVNGSTFINLFAGGQASDTITGSSTANWISGDTGNDSLTGGAGDDAFVFATALNASTNVDIITDFKATNLGTDKIWLASSVFTGLATGTLAVGDFGTAPLVGTDVVYDPTSKGLYFVAGGASTLGGYTQFATLNGSSTTTLANTDFLVF